MLCVWFLVFLVFRCKISFLTFVMCQVENNESLEGLFPNGLINCGKSFQKDSIHGINWVVNVCG